jgi:hypothetical protein
LAGILRHVKRFLLGLVTLIASTAGVAAAASGTVTVTLNPNRPSANSALRVSAQGPFKQPAGKGRVTSLRLEVQKGFSSSAKAVKVLCSSSKASNGTCPSESKVGSGSAVVTGTVNGVSGQDTITFQAFLAVPEKTGDIASIVLHGTDSVFHKSGQTRGRLLRTSSGGLELIFTSITGSSAPRATKITLDRLSLHVRAVRRATNGHTYSLITNPSRCPGRWHGALVITYSNGTPTTRPLTTACSKG